MTNFSFRKKQEQAPGHDPIIRGTGRRDIFLTYPEPTRGKPGITAVSLLTRLGDVLPYVLIVLAAISVIEALYSRL